MGHALIGRDTPRLDHLFPTLRFGDQELGELCSVTGNYIEADIVELLFDIRRIGGGGELGFKFGSHIRRQALRRSRGLPGVDHKIGNARFGGGWNIRQSDGAFLAGYCEGL